MMLRGFTNWKDEEYEDIDDNAEIDIAWDVIVQYMKAHCLRFAGEHHQYGERGAPYFDIGKKLCLSMRAWGALMAEVLDIPKDEKDGRDMSYCEWAWWADESEQVAAKRSVAQFHRTIPRLHKHAPG